MNGNSVLFVHTIGELDDQANGTLVQGTVDSEGGSLWNEGVVLKQGGTGTTTIGTGINFINDVNPLNYATAAVPPLQGFYPEAYTGLLAKLDIRTGTLALSGTSTNYDDILVHPGSTLSYLAGTHGNRTYFNSNNEFNGSILSVGGGGSVDFGDAATFDSDANALVDVTAATFGMGSYTFDNTAPGGQVIGTGTFTGGTTGTIGGAGTLEVQSGFTWNSGTFTGDGAGSSSSLLIDNGATLAIPSGDRSTTNFYSIQNDGTIGWTTSPGTLTVSGNFTQTSTGAFDSVIDTTGTSGIDGLSVGGNVTLAGALNLSVSGNGLQTGNAFTLIDNTGPNPVSGAFNGFAEGQVVTLGTVSFVITYVGGDGNDVVLKATAIPTISIASPDPILVGDTGASLNFTVSLSTVSASNVSVDYATASGSAVAGTAFQSTSGTLVIPAGQTTATITVPILGNALPEPVQTFTLSLSNPISCILGTSTATGTIVNENGPPAVRDHPRSGFRERAGRQRRAHRHPHEPERHHVGRLRRLGRHRHGRAGLHRGVRHAQLRRGRDLPHRHRAHHRRRHLHRRRQDV